MTRLRRRTTIGAFAVTVALVSWYARPGQYPFDVGGAPR